MPKTDVRLPFKSSAKFLSGPPEDLEFFAAIGRLTVWWGYIEAGIDSMVTAAYHRGRNPPGDIELPRSLKRKLRYLRQCAPAIQFPLYDRPRFEEVLEQASEAAERRHDLIHGTLLDYGDGVGASYRRLNGPGSQLRRVEVTLAGVQEEVVTATILAARFLSYLGLYYQELTGALPVWPGEADDTDDA